MLFCGLDMGISMVKAVVLNEAGPIGTTTRIAEEDSAAAAESIMSILLDRLGLKPSDVRCVVATGIGRKEVAFADAHRTEQICIARGARHLFPSARTAMDTGAAS